MVLPEDIICDAEKLCRKFVNKVNTGRARSVETYADCQDLLDKINSWKQEREELEKADN